MPTPTYTPLATVTLGTTASSVTFSSIPATYRDIVVSSELIGSFGGRMRFNSDSGTNYPRVLMYATGSAASTENGFIVEQSPSGNDMNLIQIMDYSANDKHKTVLIRQSEANLGNVTATAARWANTAAVTSITFLLVGGNLQAGTTISLYGIAS